MNSCLKVSLKYGLCSLIGLVGFYMLFKQLGFTKWVAAISIAFIVNQLFFIMPFVYCPGGEVLLFAFMGWFLYGCFTLKITWRVLSLKEVLKEEGFFGRRGYRYKIKMGLSGDK